MVNYRADAVIRRLELVELILHRTLGKHDETIKKRRNNMKEYQAVEMYFEGSRDYVKDLNFLFSKGWEFVEAIEIGNVRGGTDDVVILCRDKKENN